MTANDLAEILDRLDAAGLWYCVEGGWGVDALLAAQTRPHGDLDLAVRMEDVARLCSALPEFARDDAEWPASLMLSDGRGRRVDAHPLTFDEHGDGWQANLHGEPYRWPREHLGVRGHAGGREVRCISPELQLRWHRYDGFDDVDWADMRALCERFDLAQAAGFEERPGFLAPKRGAAGSPASA